MKTTDKPQGIAVYYDDHEQKAERFYEDFMQKKGPSELLLNASKEFSLSTNPEAEQISILCKGLYFREKGVNEKDHIKAGKLFLKSITELKKVGNNDDIVKKIELEFLKRKILAAKKDQKPPKDLFLRRAKLYKELGDNKNFNGDMSLYYMFSMLETDPFSENLLKYANLMVDHAEISGHEELLYKAKVLLHQVKSSTAPDVKTALAELENAMAAIQKTGDHYGEEDTKARLSFTRGMLTVNKKKRIALMQEAAITWDKLGNKKAATRAIKMITPVPVNVAAILHFSDEAVEKQQTLGKTINSLVKVTPGPYAVFHHHSHLIERIKDFKNIVTRLGQSRKDITDLTIRRNKLEPKKITPGKPFPKRLQKIMSKQNKLTELMKLDMESLYVFGNLLLNQWSHMMAYLFGHKEPEEFTFHRLYDVISSNSDQGLFTEIWNKHRQEIFWLYYQLRSYRNVFIEHVKQPWQRGNTMSVYGDDFNLFIPTPPGWLDDKLTQVRLKSIAHLAPQKLKDMPDDYWEKKDPKRVLEVTFFYIDGIESKQDREKVWDVWKVLGGSTPSYDMIASRLINFIFSSTSTVIDIISANPKKIKLGKGNSQQGD